MTRSPFCRSLILPGLVVCLAVLVGCGGSPAIQAHVRQPQGQVEAKSGPQAGFQAAKEGDGLQTGGAVRSGLQGSARLAFLTGSTVALRPGSFFEVGGEQRLGAQQEGTAVYRIEKSSGTIRIDSPVGHTLVLGTVFALALATDVSTLWVEEGRVTFTPQGSTGPHLVEAGRKLLIPASGTMAGPVPFDPVEGDRLFGDGGDLKINQE